VSERRKTLWLMGVLLVVVYLAAATLTYQFKHPELTDTQRLLNIQDILLWR
jgi:hypothetical protein